MRRLSCLLSAVLLNVTHVAWANPVSTDNVTARLVAEHGSAVPGESVDLALVFDIRPGWHTYWRNPGDSGEAPRIDWRLPEGVRAGPIRWPYPELIRVGPLANYGYSGRALHLIRLHIPVDWPNDRPLEVLADVSWLACEEQCIPESGALALTIQSSERAASPDPAVEELFASARRRLPRTVPSQAALDFAADGSLRLRLDAEALPAAPSRVRFFPGEWGLIEHAAEQPWRIQEGRMLVDLTSGSMAGQAATEGVLVVEGDAGASAVAISPVRVKALVDVTPNQVSVVGMGLPLALGFALLGGLILNLMPCVFPVLAMKALNLTRQRETSPRQRVLSGLSYTAGVLSFFALVAGVLLALRSGGAAVGWGYQLQYPPFVALMVYLFFVLGLNLAGAVTLGAGVMGIGAAEPADGMTGPYATGALAALVAAPCTAPFMGAALGYAITLSWPLAVLIILTLGLGLALPYLLLSLVPSAGKILPRPGRWMEDLKQFLAFPMFATAAWLVWILGVQTGPDGVAAVLAGILVLALGLWARERTRLAQRFGRFIGSGLSAAAVAVGLILGAGLDRSEVAADQQGHLVSPGHSILPAQPFSAERLRAARSSGRPVFVNMTAAWCITCLVNERVALNSQTVANEFQRTRVLYLKGDWTRGDPIITRYLERFGRTGVPIYVYYPPGGEPRVLPQILTESVVLGTLDSEPGVAKQ